MLLAGTALAMTGLALTRPGSLISVNIPGATAAPRSERTAPDAEQADSTATGSARPDKKSGQQVGDASLHGKLDLSRAKLEDGRYVVPLDKGRRAVLTLDPAVQKAAESALGRAKVPQGAIVVMAVDGRVLALAGHRDGDRGALPRLGQHLDMASSAWAPAASIFKIVTAAALVAAGLKPESRVCYHGGLRSVEPAHLVDDKARDTACGNLTEGISKSQNAIIAKLAHRHLQPGTLRTMARAFGFDDSLSFALDVEPGRTEIPAGALDFARVAAGFWKTELSPLGGALVANTVASGGMAVTPYIVDSIIEKNRSVTITPVPPRRVLDGRVAREVARMMIATVDSGTAFKGFHDPNRRRFLPEISIAGKTGTLVRSRPSYLEYSWFVGFAPSDQPTVSISVLLGNPARWHLKAHTAARMVLEAVF
ncbi:MAG TPA: penicillin-binding transpeptidase domain-containing protein [Haliangium sp.]|nr:penicillin-binding transpeptidase domain-containing protein [Haliangium sp.]